MKSNRFLIRSLSLLLVSLSLLLVVLGLLRVVEAVHASGSGTWTPTSNMTVAREWHTATLLSTGKVLVAGGDNYRNGLLASAELYNPGSGTWTTTGSMTVAREGHTATLLPDGKVLVAGGCCGYLASAELYDPSSGTWTSTGSMHVARGNHTATLLPDGKVLVAGGYNSSGLLASAELYDPSNGTWTTTGSMTVTRDEHTATLLPDGKVLVAGGYNNGSSYCLASAELYDPSRGTWTPTGSMTMARDGHTATLLPTGKVLVAGGGTDCGHLASAELYDPSSGTWTPTGSMTGPLIYHTATLLPTGKVLVAGGFCDSCSFASAELYDPSRGTWTTTGSMTAFHYLHTATLLPTGKVLVAGGNGNWGDSSWMGMLASAELYTTDVTPPTPSPTPTSTTVPSPMPTLPPGTGPVSKVWYFAEGRAGHGFDEFLTLGNPTSTNCQVIITYMTQPDRGAGSTKTVSVPVNASTRVTRWVDLDLGTTRAGPGISVAATVSVDTATTPNCTGIVAERPMYFNALGTNSGSDVVGVTKPGTTFSFADLAVGKQGSGGSYSSFLPILNPGSTAATVTATYYAAGQSVGTQTLTMAGNSRGTIFPSQAANLPPRVSVVLTSSQPIVSERPTYFSGINGGNAGIVSGAADVIGVQHLSTDWLFAEGYTGGHFQENFVLANLDPAHKSASVTITLEYDTGSSKAFTLTVNPLSQVVWNVNANSAGVAGASQSVSAEITSSGAQIAVEREMYFGYNHVGDGRTTWATGGTDVLGQLGPAAQSDYSFAEGYTNLGYDEWLTIQNPTNSTETVTVTVSNAVGTVYTFAVQVVGHSRYTVDMVAIVMQHLFHAGDGYNGYEISLAVQSSSGPLVVERPMYWNTSGTQGGSDVIGYAGG